MGFTIFVLILNAIAAVWCGIIAIDKYVWEDEVDMLCISLSIANIICFGVNLFKLLAV